MTGYVSIQVKCKFLFIPFWEHLHKIYFDDGDCETALKMARKMIKQLEAVNDE